MTALFQNNHAPVISNSNTIAGHKRSFTAESNPPFLYSSDGDFTASKRTNSHFTTTYWPSDISGISSPKTPESGIDMNAELGCSPPCYSVTRTPELATTTMNCDPTPLLTAHQQHTLSAEQSKDGFILYIADEPEENYRARYDSEGCRGPMKGRNGGCPTVELISTTSRYWLTADVKVELVAVDKSPLNSCKLDSTDDGANLCKKVLPGDSRVSFENLRIRRLKKGDTTGKGSSNTLKQQLPSKQQQAALKTTRTKQDEKVAYLLFTAHIQADYNQEKIELKVLSQAIHLNASHDPPEIHCIVPQYASEGDSVAIIGTRMHSPRVSFLCNVDGKDHEVMADINKEFSHQNALVIKVPSINPSAFSSNIATVRVCVTAGKGDRTGKEPLKSNPMPFYCVFNGVCKECVMTTARQSTFMYSNTPQQLTQPPTSTSTTTRIQVQPPPTTRLDSKPILSTQRHMTKSVSPRPHPPAPSTPKLSPGYRSPPPRTPLPPSSTNYTTYPVLPSSTVVTAPATTQQHPQMVTKTHDVVDDILSFCQSSSGAGDCPITPPQPSPHYSVIHSTSTDQLINYTDSHSGGPVSPDEFNRYLPNGNNPTVSNTYVPNSSCAVVTQDFTSVFSDASIIVQPNLGHFTQNS